MRRWWPFALVALGMTLFMGGFAWNVMFAGIPYQDPPPELAARYAGHARFAATLGWTGILSMVAGLVSAVIRRIRKDQRS